MPLSKERMRKRKRLDRLVIVVKNVKPTSNLTIPKKPELDADGNVIPNWD